MKHATDNQSATGTMICATINGKEETLASGITMRGLLDRLELHPVRVAVEINKELVPRATFDDTTIHDGDQIEIVTFVGGG